MTTSEWFRRARLVFLLVTFDSERGKFLIFNNKFETVLKVKLKSCLSLITYHKTD